MVKQALKVAASLAVPFNVQLLPQDRQDLVTVLTWQQGRKYFIGCRDSALFAVGWAGMFRCSELVGIDWRDVTSVLKGVMIYVPHSKTDQVNEGAWVFLVEGQQLPVCCPVRALRALQQLGGGEGPVFMGCLGGQRLSKSTVGPRLKKALAAAGVGDPDLYAAYSLRHGGASHAVQAGVSVRKTQMLGRWTSDMVLEYLYATPKEVWAAAAALQR
jgi:site-specific recombinase XerD